MAIFNLYSKRQRKLRGEFSEVYVYDDLPKELRIKIIYILRDSLGKLGILRPYNDRVKDNYSEIVAILCREYGLPRLVQQQSGTRDFIKELETFILKEENIERVLDVVELSISKSKRGVESIVSEVNERFKEHGVGYQYIDGEIIRIDSELIHSEVVKPALRLLNKKEYEGAQDEFLKAYEHYRHGNAKEALNECLKSFESIMKAICDKRGWTYDKNNATASKLIQVCLSHELIPKFWLDSYSSLSKLLESSVPTGRNKLSGHGQGAETTTVPDHLVAYMLHMTASALVFLGEAEAKLP